MNKFFSAIAWPFKRLFGGMQKIPGAFMSVLGGMEVVGEAIIRSFPEAFVSEALLEIALLEDSNLSGADKRASFLGWAKEELDSQGISWKERILRALLEILLSLLRGDE